MAGKRKDEKRDEVLGVRVTEAEKKVIMLRAHERGYESVSDYIRNCALGAEISSQELR